MDWDDLRFVLALARERTLAQAAHTLSVTHTTVGRRLRAVESQLGVRLFDRTPDGFLPTPAGQDLAEVAERVEGEVLSAEGRVLGRDAELQGALRVSAMDIFYCGFPEVFESFVHRYPSIDLTISILQEPVSLTRRDADVALRLTNRPPEHLVGRKLGTVQFAVYAAERLVEQVGPDASLADYPWLGWDERLDTRWIDGWVAEHAQGATVVARFDENGHAREVAVRSGLGVYFMACFEADAMPGLVRISDVVPEFAHDVWLLTLRDLRNNSRVRAFLDHMVEAFASRQDRLGGVA